jgi:Clp amino terminal domain, pathogenicity island component
MFERYTERARRVVFFARYEALEFGSPFIEPEHIVLGIARERVRGIGAIGPQLHDELREEFSAAKMRGEKLQKRVDLPLANASKRILAYAAEEAERLGHHHIGTEHLLLGVLRERGTLAQQALERRGFTLETLREQMGASPADPDAEFRHPRTIRPGDGVQFIELAYNPATESLIVEMRRYTQHGPISRISARHRNAEQYEPIANPPGNISHTGPVTCDLQPIVLFLEVECHDGGGDFHDVLCYNLLTKELTVAVPVESLVVEGHHRRVWITELHSLSADGTLLYFRFAVEREAASGTQVEYSLARIRLGERKPEILSPLKDVFY